MSNLGIVLMILGGLFGIIQLGILFMGVAMLSSGKFSNVKIGWGWGVVAAACFIAAVFV